MAELEVMAKAADSNATEERERTTALAKSLDDTLARTSNYKLL